MRCIFCKHISVGSRSVEHIMPESIGSKKRRLPAGVVCDKCNNYFARKVEQPVLNHSWMRNLRAWYQVPNKKGTYPSMIGHIAGSEVRVNWRRGQDGKPLLSTENKNDSPELARVIAEGFEQPLIFAIEDDPPPREMSRFLCKMALEAVAELFYPETERLADEAFFDSIRNYARHGMNFKEWPYSQRRVFPQNTLMRHPNTNQWVQAGFGYCLFMNKRQETLFAFVFYGVEFVVNVGGPSIAGYQEWLGFHNGISPLVERLGCRLVVEGEGKSSVHYLHGSFNSKAGLQFDKTHGYHQFRSYGAHA
jgi:hypothetical protein